MPTVSRRTKQLIAACGVIVLLLVVLPRGSSAQTAGTLEVGSVTHSADGTITVSLTAGPDVLESLAVFVDGAALPFEVSTGRVEAASRIVFAIENSVSMTAAQLADLQGRASELVAALDAADQVGIVTFGGGATVALSPTTDRAAFDTALHSITADGGSALYSGVTAASEMMTGSDGAALMVLATYGWDWGGLSADSREASLAAAAASGAQIYVQSMVFDGSFDAAYLASLASDGIGHNVTDLASLPNARSLLGVAEPGATLIATAPPLALGDHEFRVVSDAAAEHVARFVVTNDGLLTATVNGTGESGDPIAVRLASAAGLSGLDVSAAVSGAPLDVASDGSITVDPWVFAAGVRRLDITAMIDGAVAYELSQPLTIPGLAPLLTVDQSDEQSLLATLRSQPSTVAELVALVDGVVVGESPSGSLQVDRPDIGELTFEARAADGVVLASEQVSATAVIEPTATTTPGAAGTPFWQSPTMLAIPLALIAFGVFLGRRRSRRSTGGVAEVEAAVDDRDLDGFAEDEASLLLLRPEPAVEPEPEPAFEVEPEPVFEAEPEPPMSEAEPGPPTPIRPVDWAVVVRYSDGLTRRVNVGQEPVSIGASKLCTVTLEGDAVRFVHLVVARDGGEIRAHQFGPVAIDGREQNVEADAVLTSSMMQIGDASIWLEEAVEAQPAADAA